MTARGQAEAATGLPLSTQEISQHLSRRAGICARQGHIKSEVGPTCRCVTVSPYFAQAVNYDGSESRMHATVRDTLRTCRSELPVWQREQIATLTVQSA